MVSHGTVREWDDDEGWGVIDSADTPGGCFAHFASIVMDGYRRLAAGGPVTFTWEAARQDGFGYRAVQVWPPGARPGAPAAAGPEGEPSAAYGSTLTIRRADGTVTQYRGDEPRPFPPA